MLPISPSAEWLRTKWLGSKWLRSLWGRMIDSPCPKRRRPSGRRRLYLEPLEDRTMLSVSVSVTGSDATFVSTDSSDKVYLQTIPNGASNKVQWSSDNSTWRTYQIWRSLRP